MKTKDVIRIGRKRTCADSIGRVKDALAGRPAFARHFDDEDRVLRREGDEQDQSDLHVNVVRHAERKQHADGAQQGQRHGQDDGGRA